MRGFHCADRRDALDRQYRLCGEVLKRYEARSLSSETRLLYQDLVSSGGAPPDPAIPGSWRASAAPQQVRNRCPVVRMLMRGYIAGCEIGADPWHPR